MDSKTLKLYEVLMQFTDEGLYVRKDEALKFAEAHLKLGLDYGLDACHYLFLKHEKLFEYNAVTTDIAVTFLNRLLQENRTKVQRAIVASPVLIKGFFTLNDRVFSGEPLELLVSLMENGKEGDADTLLRAIFKNEYVAFGPGMKILFETYFARLSAKQDTKRPAIPKKMLPLLQACIDKIKTEEKHLLTQRLKELL